MKKYLWLILIFALLGGGYGYYQYNRPVASLEDKSADMTLGASDLLKAFETDENTANTNYLDKIIVVKGEVSKVEDDGVKKSIYLKTGNEMSSVICEMEAQAAVEGLTQGASVAVKGKCTGYLMDVVLVQCVITKQ